MSIWFTLIVQPLINIIIFFYQALGSNLGLAVIASTIAIRGALIPLTNPGMKSAQKLQELKPQLDKLKLKHKDDKQALAQAQLDLYRKHGVNPVGSLLPTILQFVILIGLFQGFSQIFHADITASSLNEKLYSFLQLPLDHALNMQFAYWNLGLPDTIKLPSAINLGIISLSAVPGIFLTASALVQFISTKYMMPVKPVSPQTKSDKNAEPDMATMMQKQMMFMMPIMTLLIGYSLPAGVVLYWMTFSILMIVQQKWLNKTKTLPSTRENKIN